tara:strand:+ start:57 stop:941 length:885 start_codon:yes stop_codon:yes gene_type:complete
MKRLLLLTAILLTACASGPKWNWEVQPEEREDGIYGSWVTSNPSNEFGSWTSSKVLGTKSGWLKKQPFIEVQGSHYVGVDIGDSYICGDSINTKLAWEDSSGRKFIETLYFRTSKNNETLIFSDRNAWALERNRFLYQLNLWDKVTIQTEDTCGEVTIVRFDIEGTHHVSTIETNSEGFIHTIKSEGSMSDHIKYHKKGVFGFNFQDLTDDARRLLDRDSGVKVISVVKGSPVDNGGLLVGDYVIFLDNKPLNNVAESMKVFDEGDYSRRSKATLTVIRDGQTKKIEVDLQGED